MITKAEIVSLKRRSYLEEALRRMGRENNLAINSRVQNRRDKSKSRSRNPKGQLKFQVNGVHLNDESSHQKHPSTIGPCRSCSPSRKTKVSHSNRRFRVRLVNETIELKTSISETVFNRGRQPSRYRRHHKSTRTHLRLGCRLLGVETSNSFESGSSGCRPDPGSSNSNNGSTRARSESQSDYSPKRRNDELLRQSNGSKTSCSRMARSRYRSNRRSKERHAFRRRINSAPEEIQSFQTINEESKPHSSGQDEHRWDVIMSIPSQRNHNTSETVTYECHRHPCSAHLSPYQRQPSAMTGSDFPTGSTIQGVPCQLAREPRKCSIPCQNEGGRTNLLRRGENRITRIALAIVWLFLFCHSWKLVPTFYEAIYASDNWPPWLIHVNDISHSFIVFNSAVNFLLYTVL
eukprot:maker-scaffold252_size238019-snap-gene-0.6 protein:Tk06191 transcript:maker-scaffold252_size238019-snap-gene-0.6-mRNA-1 annotation:"hypothetical protein CAPTEDRAFT_116396"